MQDQIGLARPFSGTGSSAHCTRAIPKCARRSAYGVLLLAALGCVFHTPLLAQQPATISGSVADPSGAGVPNASLTLTNQDTTAVLMTAKSDSDGNFAFPAVPAP